MLVLYLYILILLLMCILSFRSLDITMKFAPKKIRILSIVGLALALLRILSLLVMSFLQNVMFLYLLKPFVFLNLLYIPIITIIVLYIFLRNDKIKFSYSFILCGVLSITYLLMIYFVPAAVQTLPKYGYTMVLQGNTYISFASITLDTLVLMFCIVMFGKPVVNNLGISMMIISLVLSITDVLTSMIGYEYLPHNIIGELFFIITINYGLLTFKK